MRARSFLLLLSAVFVLAFGAAPAQADSVVNVNISNLTFSGNNVCGSSGTHTCTLVLSVSFEFDETTILIVPNTLSTVESGDLTGFSFDPARVFNSFGFISFILGSHNGMGDDFGFGTCSAFGNGIFSDCGTSSNPLPVGSYSL